MYEEKQSIMKVIGWLHSDDAKKKVIAELKETPDYFWHVPASSSGKYHPKYALGEGGLARHTVCACWVAKELFRIYHFTPEEEDIILVSLILHDSRKQGDGSTAHTQFDHPLIEYNHLLDKYGTEDDLMSKAACCISSHMGQWNKDKRSKVELPLPTSDIQFFVHLCDYLASRKCLIFEEQEAPSA